MYKELKNEKKLSAIASFISIPLLCLFANIIISIGTFIILFIIILGVIYFMGDSSLGLQLEAYLEKMVYVFTGNVYTDDLGMGVVFLTIYILSYIITLPIFMFIVYGVKINNTSRALSVTRLILSTIGLWMPLIYFFVIGGTMELKGIIPITEKIIYGLVFMSMISMSFFSSFFEASSSNDTKVKCLVLIAILNLIAIFILCVIMGITGSGFGWLSLIGLGVGLIFRLCLPTLITDVDNPSLMSNFIKIGLIVFSVAIVINSMDLFNEEEHAMRIVMIFASTINLLLTIWSVVLIAKFDEIRNSYYEKKYSVKSVSFNQSANTVTYNVRGTTEEETEEVIKAKEKL